MAKKKASNRRRCLIVERHPWETGGAQQQLQIPLTAARKFFGGQDRKRTIRIRLWMGTGDGIEKEIVISKAYKNGTRRTNGFPEMGAFPAGFVFFEESTTTGLYDVWWQDMDLQIVAAKYSNWTQGKDSQHGRGRLAKIVRAPVDRPIKHV
jgi:hypothetical protein